MKLLHSVPEPPLGLIHFGNSLTVGGQPAFGNFANEEILFIASNILKTSVIEHRKDIVGDRWVDEQLLKMLFKNTC